jgi:2-iminobutanoate/2-iminopropanoate deaminase
MASKRQVIEIPGVKHSAPIPMAVRYGNMLFTSAIMGIDAHSGTLGEGPDQQARFAFDNLRTVLESAGAGPDNIVRMTVHLTDHSYREAINKPWLEWFPDEHDRPARHSVLADLPRGFLLQIEVVAIID